MQPVTEGRLVVPPSSPCCSIRKSITETQRLHSCCTTGYFRPIVNTQNIPRSSRGEWGRIFGVSCCAPGRPFPCRSPDPRGRPAFPPALPFQFTTCEIKRRSTHRAREVVFDTQENMTVPALAPALATALRLMMSLKTQRNLSAQPQQLPVHGTLGQRS